MKKTFQLKPEGKNPDRVLDAVKHEVRKYVKRERNKVLPEGVDFWDFDCRVGANAEAAGVVHLAEVNKELDAVAAQGASEAYVEVLAKAGYRKSREE